MCYTYPRRPFGPLLCEQHISGNTLKAVRRAWLATHVLAGCAFICACAATSEWNGHAKDMADIIEQAGDRNDNIVVSVRRSKTSYQSNGFVCIMTGFVAVLMAVAGHYTLTKLKGPLALGIFTGGWCVCVVVLHKTHTRARAISYSPLDRG